jgi:hypothetical protein
VSAGVAQQQEKGDAVTSDLGVDVDVLKREIKKTYASVSAEPERHGFERIETGDLVATYANSKFEDTRDKAFKFGANGSTVKAYKS